jgi:ribosome maturation factor RimP
MSIAHEKLDGLDRERVRAVVLPVLRAHSVDAVELVWKTDRGGWVLELTLERPGTRLPGEGITIDLCSEISRDLSAALDVAEAIPHRYSLEVGSPGVERRLYSRSDYERFAGQLARIKVKAPVGGQSVLRGTLHGLDEQGQILLESERGEVIPLTLESIDSARLIFEIATGQKRPGKGSSRANVGRGPRAQRHQR